MEETEEEEVEETEDVRNRNNETIIILFHGSRHVLAKISQIELWGISI